LGAAGRQADWFVARRRHACVRGPPLARYIFLVVVFIPFHFLC